MIQDSMFTINKSQTDNFLKSKVVDQYSVAQLITKRVVVL